MARLFANYSIDMSNLNLNRLVTGFYDSQFVNNDYLAVNGYTYEDTLEVIYYAGGYATALFGGSGFTFNQSGDLAGGTVTGYLQGLYSGATPVPWWGVENFTYSAASMYNAGLTSSTSDDYLVISSILSGSDAFYLSSYADKVNGYAGNDAFYGGAGKDTLDGGSGTDTADYSEKTTAVKVTLNGSTNATVYVNATAEDTIKNIENLTAGSGADQLTGDSLANTLKGNAGNDLLKGGAGKDILYGGTGADKFVFDTTLNATTNLDTIKDFALKSDKIVLDDDIFEAFAGKSAVSSSQLKVVNSVSDLSGNGYLTYVKANDTLYYDSNGSGTGDIAFVKIELAGTAAPSATDFLVIA